MKLIKRWLATRRQKQLQQKVADARPVAPGEIKQLWEHPAFKYAIQQVVEDIKGEWLFAQTPERREAAHQEFQAVQRATFKLEQLYNHPK